MGASDYVTVQAPNFAAYQSPNFGLALGDRIADFPESYMKGREMKQARQAQDAFPNGLDDPRYKNPDGSPNVNAIVSKGAQIGGMPFVMRMLPFLSPPPSGPEEPTIGGGTTGQPPVSRRIVPNAAGPANVAAPQQPKLSSAGADNEGEQTINSLASEVFGERDVTNLLPNYAAAVGNKLGEPLTPEQTQAARAMMQRSKGAMASASPEDITPSGQPSSAAEQASNGPGGRNAAPFAAGGVSGSPAPPAGPQRVAQAQSGAGTTGLLPNWTESKAAEYETSARNHMKVADYYARMGNKEGAANQREQASKLFDTAKMIRERMATNAELTAPGKEARESGIVGGPLAMEGFKTAQKEELARGDALQKGVQAKARDYDMQLKPHLDAMRGVLNDPNLVSGAGVNFQEALNRIRSSPLFKGLPGYDPNAALPNEAIRKVVATSVLDYTNELKAEAAEMGGTAGRIFQQQIALAEKASQNPDNSASALRFLTELQTRMGEHSKAVAELANNYRGKYGRGVLDNGFNEALAKFNSETKNQIFKPREIEDIRTFAPPVAPRLDTKEQAIAWARKAGLNPGDPMKLPSGKIVSAP